MKQKNIFRLLLVLFPLWGLNISNICGQNHWTPVPGGSGNIIIYTYIYIDGILANRGDVELGAFRVSDDVCRGSKLAVDTWNNGDYYVTLMVSGNDGDSFYYRIYDHSTGKEYAANGITLTKYVENAKYGSIDDIQTTSTSSTSSIFSTLTIDGNITNGSIEASPSGSIEAGAPVTLTIHPAAGYELNTISAYKTNAPATTYGLTGSGIIDNSTYTFNMPGYNTTVTVTYTVTHSGIESPQSAKLQTISTDGGLQLRGLVPGETFSIYHISGHLHFKGKATATGQTVQLRERGIYIVVSGNHRVKAVY
jgi:hypothetical protein